MQLHKRLKVMPLLTSCLYDMHVTAEKRLQLADLPTPRDNQLIKMVVKVGTVKKKVEEGKSSMSRM